MMSDTNEDPNEETIKCVVVGDNNTGKTRLICSRAYNESAPNYRCISNACHIPTVWAIDQYRMNNEVLQNARCNIDGVDVSLRLWDTFGDHHKNRKYALGKADIVLICFSVCDRNSLLHVKNFWAPEIRKQCRNVPIILVACKIDLRFIDLVKANRAKGIYVRPVKYNDLLYPEECSLQAKKLGCLYYETSVFLGHGVNEVFENACRAALFHRKSISVWTNSSLKKVKRPGIQKPLEPPKPRAVEIVEFEKETSSPCLHNIISLFQLGTLSDVKFICQGEVIKVHKSIISAASDVFLHLLIRSEEEDVFEIFKLSERNDEEDEQFRIAQLIKMEGDPDLTFTIDVNITLMRSIFFYCYTGTFHHPQDNNSHINQLYILARSFQLIPSNFQFDHQHTSTHDDSFNRRRGRRIDELLLTNGRDLFTDVRFIVDDGEVDAHKLLLAGGSDVMRAMFTGNFVESSTNQVKMPGTTCGSLRALIKFVYTGHLSNIADKLALVRDLLCLANRLCLPRLIFLVENQTIEKFEEKEKQMNDKGQVSSQFLEDIVSTLELAKFHNARNLSKWCLRFLSVHYNQACWTIPKLIKAQPPTVQRYIEENRWPPVWYIKQKDVYDKALYLQKKAECGGSTTSSGTGGIHGVRKYKNK